MKLEEKVRRDVERLLALVCNDATDAESYEFVLNKLTKMAIIGTTPVGSMSAPKAGSVTSPPYDIEDDPSLDKERWIAP